ncbi:hypothetical protein BgAZ_201250 [Babesia gibsoni]|uniref:Uncharacterized protein n=1 Tax=Babesia gibsoni TaxID=33632 RepID=A0AAD8LJ94_BABGI|nr:hypothetical protein BgAZ_201250 [Babesia gibsoni]
MFLSSYRRGVATGIDAFVDGLKRYRLLSSSDKRKLLGAHRLKKTPEAPTDKIENALELSNESSSVRDLRQEASPSKRIEAELKRLKSRTREDMRARARMRPMAVGVSKYFMGVDPNTEPEYFEITNPLFDSETETMTLVSDVQKATAYDDVQAMLASIRPVPQDKITDDFLHIMARAIEYNIARVERPVLFNELSDYESSYAMQRAAIRNLLINRCTRNAFEETRVDKFIDKLKLSSQRLNAPLPPEAIEPVIAFRGYATYSFDPCRRLAQKLTNMQRLVQAIVKNDTDFLASLGTSAECQVGPLSKYPFNNYYGFESCVPKDVTGSIKMGKPVAGDSVRYQNLQSVAHSLPKDRKYRSVVTHAIRVLERAKGWDHKSKIKAINRLVQVYNNLAPSRYYERVLEKSIPLVRTKGSVVRTRSRQETFNRGLKYIQSLTRNHWVKKK